MNKFKLSSRFEPTKDQRDAISKLSSGINNNIDYQVLLGVTGSGKTFTIANVIEKLQRPTLIISHNKTLAAQLYQEFREFFPDNAVSYFVSYYDYYQPEAYIPSTDTYIEKDAGINELIDKLRLQSTTNLLTRNDCIVIASVSCIYNIGSPKEYGNFIFEFKKGENAKREDIIERLIELQYERSEFGFHRGTFRVRGNIIDIYPAYQDEGIRIDIESEKIKTISSINTVSGKEVKSDIEIFVLYPAKHYITDPNKNIDVFKVIKSDANKKSKQFEKRGKIVEAERIKKRVNYDLEMISEMGYVKGIENYSRYFDGRKPGEAPYTLLDYFSSPFKKDWLVVVDESHITFPQIRGMYNGDRARKETLIDYGFRLPAAIDNRPLKFEEFIKKIPNFIATSATPADWEISMSTNKKRKKGVVQQLLRPTGIPDPKVNIRPTKNQVMDVIEEIKTRAKKKQRTLVTTLTKQTAEDLSEYLKDKNIKVHYLHSDIKTLERTDILDSLRKGEYDCIVGVNLLREGLDLPEVTLVAILDADKEGFLRSEVSLIQTMGRAARHKDGEVILYADRVTGSMDRAIKEVERRRKYQIAVNKKFNIKPTSIKKPIRNRLIENEKVNQIDRFITKKGKDTFGIFNVDVESLTPIDKKKYISNLRREMHIAAKDLDFELAIRIRDTIKNVSD
ncbi:excinuclease ABC subunit UvrB [Patescibacteria group bacterium]